MDLTAYRASKNEQQRYRSLLNLIPRHGSKCLDVGARDGYLSKLLTDYYTEVTALDLDMPNVAHENIVNVKGDVTRLDFPDNLFDMVFCAEVLEHIPSHLLHDACGELVRVSKGHLIIGVPYKQDLRVGRTTCQICGERNPPWGHVNSFDVLRLSTLFAAAKLVESHYIGETREVTNSLSTLLMDFAGNPFGTYYQEEPCIACGNKLTAARPRSMPQKFLTQSAVVLTRVQRYFVSPNPKWVHVLFEI